MERAGRIFSRLLAARQSLPGSQLAAAAWPAAVGAKLAKHSRVTSFENGRLVVEADDALWRKNMDGLSRTILANLRRLMCEAAPAAIEFRVGAPRRPSMREGGGLPGLFAEEPLGLLRPTSDAERRKHRRKAGA